MRSLATIGFDADDTLWHNERNFRLTQDRFFNLLDDFGDAEKIAARLLETEKRNLRLYGYGVKGFTLSLLETALEVTEGRIDTRGIAEILAWGREMLTHPVEPLPQVRETLLVLRESFELVLITKGDLFDQERKLAESGLGELFLGVEIVSEKTEATYRDVFQRHGPGADRALMVGNSMKSDVLPALAAGCWGVHVPHEITWELELADDPVNEPRFRRIDVIGQLPELVASIA